MAHLLVMVRRMGPSTSTDEALDELGDRLASLRFEIATLRPDANIEYALDAFQAAGQQLRTVEAALEKERAKERAREVRVMRAHKRSLRKLALAQLLRVTEAFDPHGWHVYLLWGDDKTRPLYIGQSTNVLARLGSHLIDPTKRAAVRRTTIIRCKSKRDMNDTELRLIGQLGPEWNIRSVA